VRNRYRLSRANLFLGIAVAGCCAAFICYWAVPHRAAAATQPPPVILISVDTMRADHLGVYGYRRARTPNIDSFADGGTVFRQVGSQIPLTLPSHFSLFTSTYPFTNRIEENAEQVPSGAITLPSILRARGYRTAAFIGSVYLERELGFDQGFDFYDSPFSFEAFSSLAGSMFYGDRNRDPLRARDRRDGALVVRAALQWLRANREQPVFAFLHLFDLHLPYRLPPSAAKPEATSGYDAELEYIDRLMGSFRQALVRDGWWDRSLVILLSDHGEGLGEHGEQTHGYFIYQSTLHVPLIIHWPSAEPGPKPSGDQSAGLIDVAPTVLDFLHFPAPPSFAGRSLLQPNLASASPAVVYGESVYSHDAFGWSALRSLRAGKYKYIAAPRAELYDLEADPNERSNVIAQHPAESRALAGQLANLLARYASAHPASSAAMAPDKLAALKSLGYLAPGQHPPLETSGSDPKDRLAEYKLYERAQDEILSGRTATAIAILCQLLDQDPRNTLARRDLGVAYNAETDYAKARASLQPVVAAAPVDFVAHFELALADEHLGLLPEALDHLRIACGIAPQSGGCQRELKAVQEKMGREAPSAEGKMR
jgi:arylsulfatase A-like enzyme